MLVTLKIFHVELCQQWLDRLKVLLLLILLLCANHPQLFFFGGEYDIFSSFVYNVLFLMKGQIITCMSLLI